MRTMMRYGQVFTEGDVRLVQRLAQYARRDARAPHAEDAHAADELAAKIARQVPRESRYAAAHSATELRAAVASALREAREQRRR